MCISCPACGHAILSSLVARPEKEEEEKGPGFSRSRMRLIIADLTTCRSVGGCQ